MKDKKMITQVTFDAAVKENMNDFGMNLTEALRDAISQFEAQDVDLSNIVTNLDEEEDPQDAGVLLPSEKASRLVECLKTLTQGDLIHQDELSRKFADIKEECDADLARRCLIGGYDLAGVLFDIVKKFDSNTEVLLEALSIFVSLTNGQPDVIKEDHIQYFCQKILDKANLPAVLCGILKVLFNCCLRHEANRQANVRHGVIEHVMDVLQRHKSEADLMRQCCALLRVLTFDDDIRVPYGKAHDHAKKIVMDHAGIKVLLGLAKDVAYDVEVNIDLMTTLSSLAVRNEFCQEIVDEGGLDFVFKTVLENIQNQRVVLRSLALMKTIAGNDKVKGDIVKAGGVELVLSTMAQHEANSQVCDTGCACLAALALRSPLNCQAIVEAGGVNSIVSAMKIHKDVMTVQKSACRAIRNLVSRTHQYRPNFLECSVETLIGEARQRHQLQVEDDAKAALRDLGCKVELQELWTGQKGAIVN